MGYPVLRVVPPEALRGLFQVHYGQSDQRRFPRNSRVGSPKADWIQRRKKTMVLHPPQQGLRHPFLTVMF